MAPDVSFGSTADMNEFTKYSKFLAYKAVQVIVESRNGIKLEPNSKTQSSDLEWFNLRIPDNPDVNRATKTAMPSDRVLETFEKGLHVEISVKTEDEEEMVLEIWTIGLDETQCDPSLTGMSTLYSKMSCLLKSLITFSRVTPAYQLSRRQHTENFTIFYNVYNGETKNKLLGESIKTMDFAMLRTPRGGIYFAVSYRTDLSIASNKSKNNKDSGLLLKSDHFEMSPKRVIVDNSKREMQGKSREIDINKPLRLAAFVDELLIKQVFEEFFKKYPLPRCKFNYMRKSSENGEDIKEISEVDSAIVSKTPSSLDMHSKKSMGSHRESEAPLKLLYFPFADDHPIRELAEFYKDFFNARHSKLTEDVGLPQSVTPGLPSFHEEIGNVVDSFASDLKMYESSVQEFDELLADMYRSTEWTGS